MKLFYVFLAVILVSCSHQLISIDKNEVTNEAVQVSAEDNAPTPTNTGQNGISIEQYGGKGDAVQRDDFSVKGNLLSVTESIFSSNDIGKIASIAFAGNDREHLIGKIKKIVSVKSVELDVKAANAVQNVLGSFGTDNMLPTQRAFEAAIEKNVVLYIPEGIYLIGDRNPENRNTSVRIKMTKPNQNLVIVGAGKDKSIFRELDGKTQRFGRYTKMFYHYLKGSPNIGVLSISNIGFDKNGRSLTKNPKVFYEWEQAHCFGWAMASKEQSAEYIGKIYLKNIEVIDKVGAGINFSSGPTKVNSFIAENITERDFNGNQGNVQYGQRGDLEISCFSEDIQISNCDLRYIQIEPVLGYSSDASNRRYCKVSNSNIGVLEYTESDNKDPRYSKLEAVNLTSERFVARSVFFRVRDSDIKIPALINSVDGVIRNSRIRIPYDKEKNTVTPVNSSHLRTLNSIHNKMTFDTCVFEIEDNDPNIKPLGAAIRAGGKVKDLSQNKVTIINSTFDNRLQTSIDAYANGTWIVKNNNLSGKEQAILVGGYKDLVGDITISGNNYDNLLSNKPKVRILNNNKLWKLKLDSNDKLKTSFIKVKGSQGDLKKQISTN